MEMYFRGGPLFVSKCAVHLRTELSIPPATVLATYASEMAEKNKYESQQKKKRERERVKRRDRGRREEEKKKQESKKQR